MSRKPKKQITLKANAFNQTLALLQGKTEPQKILPQPSKKRSIKDLDLEDET